MNFAFMLFRGQDVSTTFAQNMSYQFQIALSVPKILWPLPRKDIQPLKPSLTSWKESMFSASACTRNSCLCRQPDDIVAYCSGLL